MPWRFFAGSQSTRRVDAVVDTDNPFLNRAINAFIYIGAVGACRIAALETYHFLLKGNVSRGKLQGALSKMWKEGAYWGIVAGLYIGMEYGMERMCGATDWKNALLGGAITGALISAASNKSRDEIIKEAITGGAIATAAEFLNYLP